MATQTVPCRVCGKIFVPCNKSSASIGAFNYHAVACSPECGTEYLRRVQAARQKPTEQNIPDATVSTEEIGEVKNDAVPKEYPRDKRREGNFIEEFANIED